MTRRGSSARPTFGVHLSYYDTNADQNSILITSKEQRPGIDPELGLIVEAPNHILVQTFFRIDVGGIAGGVFLATFGIGAGAHF